MMRLLADENFNGKVLSGLRTALPELDIVRVQDTEMYQAPDPELLTWAAEQGRILLTHDIQTMAGYAYDRVQAGLPMPGVIEVRLTQGIGASTPDEFNNRVRHIPLHE